MPRGGRKGGNRGGNRGGARAGRDGGRRQNGKDRGAQADQSKDNGGYWGELKMQNGRFEAYYLDQGIVPADQWAAFMDAFRQPLPTTFRFTAGKATTPQLIKQMKERFVPELSGIEFGGEPVPPPQPLSWYPEGLAWQVDVKKAVLRKQEDFKNFQRFLVNETEVGSISRQEAVSMIPPLFLDVRPEHMVLDMCAAPGSKTSQLIEALHSPMTSSPEHYDPCPPGLIIANDADNKRAYMLVHQATRLPSPNLCVTNVDAGAWPKVQVPWKSAEPESPVVPRELRFDRILGDVPCSGDGTLRKNVGIWREWNLANGQGLHALQVRILLRGLSSLRPGGRLVYSTCSLNPIENEAVIAAALRECGADPSKDKEGTVRLVDVSDQIPQLKRTQGLTTWKVCPGRGRHLFDGSDSNMRPKQAAKQTGPKDGDAEGAADAEAESKTEAKDAEEDAEADAPADAEGGEAATEEQPLPGTPEYRAKLPAIPWVDSWEKLEKLDPSLASRTAKTLWPQGDEEKLNLHRCMRVYPHFQNTGGFFITVLEKAGSADGESQSAGILRAVEAMDKGADAPQYAGTASKRALSPTGDEDGEEPAKRTRVADTPAEDTEIALEGEAEDYGVPDAPTTHVKPDNHAAARLASKQKQRNADKGFGLPGGTPFKEDPYSFVSIDNPEVQNIQSFFGFKADFPARNLLVRNPDGIPARTIYLASTALRGLVSGGGPGIGHHISQNPVKLRVLNAGIKTFARQDSNRTGTLECKWRVVADGLAPVRPFIRDEAVIPTDLRTLAFLLSEYYPTLDSLPEGDFRERVKAAKMGSHVMEVKPSSHDGATLAESIDIPIWRAGASVNLMLDKAERSALSLRIFDTDLSLNASKNVDASHGKSAVANTSTKTSTVAAVPAVTEEEMAEAENAAAAVVPGAPVPEAPATAAEAEKAQGVEEMLATEAKEEQGD